ncbi:biliverdin-producing heme oxygenase [Aurantiacibacter rhizosphaerae]|uniref:Heme oxygenase n=1 Tax=Aurantiacibacter rhizosphaerae TaxID=2691582 RepID=A0A844XF00_9SPHN|nr:biliverdin-producing heme oxygenase [Aurantiacibacter rhizosphaerae]MWV28242.1 hypothetical protein [Aurantiacibacter rhizosphaerae]
MQPTLRERLRRETGDIHEQVEEAFAHLDLATSHGLAATLRAHIRVMERVLPNLARHADYQQEVQRLHDLAVQSLAASQTAAQGEPTQGAVGQPVAPPVQLHPLSAIYVIFGSRLGSRVIASNLKLQEITWPQAAIAYFTDDQTRHLWRQFVQELKEYEDQGDRIVAEAVSTFNLFLSEAREARALLQSST